MLKQIDRSKYLQVVGLLTISDGHISALQDIEKALHKLFKTTPEDAKISEHIADAIYSSYSAEGLMEKLGVVVDESGIVK